MNWESADAGVIYIDDHRIEIYGLGSIWDAACNCGDSIRDKNSAVDAYSWAWMHVKHPDVVRP